METSQPGSRSDAGASQASWPFRIALAVLLAIAAWQALAVARAEWFSRDDFTFLLFVQRSFRWGHALLPLEGGFWWAWRPLGMDGFFRVAYRTFGLEPFGWFAAALAVHFALGPAVFALARRVGLTPAAAWASGALAVVLPPALVGFAYASIFHYLAASLLGCLSLALFRERRGATARVASCVGFAAALLCNESALVLVAVAGILALQDQPGHGWRRVPPALRAVAPWLGVAALYAVLRLAVVDLADPPAAYRPRFGANLIRHFWMQPRYLAGGGSRLAVALLGLLAVVALCIRRARTGDADPLRRLLRAYTWLGPWLVLAIAVFATLPFSHSRFAMTLQVPGALLLGVHLDALWRLFADRRAALLRAVFVGVVALALPLGALRDRAAHPVGADARVLVEGVARLHPHPPVGVPLLLIYGGDGLADRTRVDELRRRTYNGIAVRAVHAPELGPVRFVGVQEASRVDCPRCLRVGLTPDLRVIPYGSP